MVARMIRAPAFIRALLFSALALLLPATAAQAQSGARVVETVSWVEEWDPVSGQWLPVEDDSPASFVSATSDAAATATTTTTTGAGSVTITETVVAEPVRFIARPAMLARPAPGLAQYGPFRVLDDSRAALVATTDAASPAAFQAMLAAHPGLAVIEFADAPGTSNDLANLQLGRAIRTAGLATHVPDGGSARSGAVELFLAGTRRTIAPGALFAVHSWRDEAGREPADFAADAPANRLYLDYYAEMGMNAADARAFYAMTNSVPHASALWLEGEQMARWIASDVRTPATRSLDAPLESALRLALARSGDKIAAVMQTSLGSAAAAQRHLLRMSEFDHFFERNPPALSLAMDEHGASPFAPLTSPKLGYANLGTGLLDSAPAFP